MKRRSALAAPATTSPYIYLTIGQDYESIRAYLDDVDSDTPPHAYMVYTDLQTLVGLTTPVNYGSGIEYANGVLELSHQYFPNAWPSLQIGLWLNGTQGCRDILNQHYQLLIQQLFRYCIVECAHEVAKVYLRIGYEFDNPDFHYMSDPETYRRTFQYLVDECARLYTSVKCRDKIEFVWHSWAATDYTSSSSVPSLNDFYPGDDYVDWIGISIFSQLYTDNTRPRNVTALGTQLTVRTICNFARNHNKRLLIAESTPFGGLNQLKDPWSDWFVPVLDLIEEYSDTIHMWSYIYCNWNVQPMWRTAGFGDSRLSQNVTLLRLWQQQVVSNPRFLSEVAADSSQNALPSLALAHLHPPFPEAPTIDYTKSSLYLILVTVSVAVAIIHSTITRWAGREDAAGKCSRSLAGNPKPLLSQSKASVRSYGTIATQTRSKQVR